jgi:hypothetical protein
VLGRVDERGHEDRSRKRPQALMRVSEITGVGRLNVDERIELLPMDLLHHEDALERLAAAAAQATAVSVDA